GTIGSRYDYTKSFLCHLITSSERFYLTACSLFAASIWLAWFCLLLGEQLYLASYERLVTRAKDQKQGQKGKRLTLPSNDFSLSPSLPASLCRPLAVQCAPMVSTISTPSSAHRIDTGRVGDDL